MQFTAPKLQFARLKAPDVPELILYDQESVYSHGWADPSTLTSPKVSTTTLEYIVLFWTVSDPTIPFCACEPTEQS